MIGMSAKLTTTKLEKGEADREATNRSFNRLVKMLSSVLALTPCVLNYLNKSVQLAVLSAVLQMITEVLGKVWIVYFTRKTLDVSHTYEGKWRGRCAVRSEAEFSCRREARSSSVYASCPLER
jgi:hypothetical protein